MEHFLRSKVLWEVVDGGFHEPAARAVQIYAQQTELEAL